MKNIIFSISVVLAVLFSATTELYAQDKKAQKAEYKSWKKKLKKLDPLQLRDMTQELNTLRKQVSGLKAEISNLEKDKTTLEEQLKSKDDQLSDVQGKYDKLKAEMSENVTRAGDDWTKGVVYKVQVGAFRNKDLSQFQDHGNFWVEDEDGVKKYTIAYFRDYNEADQFKKYMRAMGVKDAWIVAYEDNVRKDIKDVMGSTQKNAPAQKKRRSRR